MITVKDLIKDYILVSLFAFIISVVLTPLIRRKCQQKHLLDFPVSPRKIHTVPVPRLGGIAIYLAFYLPLLTLFFDNTAASQLSLYHLDFFISLFVTSTLVFAVGVYDDIRGATVLQKLSVQAGAAILLYFLGFQIKLLAIPFLGPVDLGVLGFPVTILWLVGVTNALNFIDGIDGLACGVGFFSVSTVFILSLLLNRALIAFFAVALAGGLFGFAVYNFNPASIFMGDSGSLFVGFIIAAISLHGTQKSSTAVVLLIPIVALGVPLTDTGLAILRRIGKGISPFSADKEHIHHRLLRMGLSSRQVTLVLYGVCSILGITALLMTAVNNKMLTLILIMLSIIMIGGMKMLGYTADMVNINNLARERIQQKRRFNERQKYATGIFSEIQTSSDIPTLRKTLIRYFENMEFDVATFWGTIQVADLHCDGSVNQKRVECVWQSPQYVEQAIDPDHIWTITVPLIVNNKKCGELFIGKALDSPDALFESITSIESLKHALEQSCFQHGVSAA